MLRCEGNGHNLFLQTMSRKSSQLDSSKRTKPKSFADFKLEAANWITLATGEYYPDILKDACELYKPVLVLFGQLLKTSESSIRLFMQIAEQTDGWMRVQLARVFRKYVSPETPVEMLKKKTQAEQICREFGKGFRPVQKVQAAFASRPIPDEALCAVLWEYKDRGKKGYQGVEKVVYDQIFAKTPMILMVNFQKHGLFNSLL